MFTAVVLIYSEEMEGKVILKSKWRCSASEKHYDLLRSSCFTFQICFLLEVLVSSLSAQADSLARR